MRKRNFVAMLLSVCCIFLAFTACAGPPPSSEQPPALSINVSSVKLSSVIGEYELPDYFVVDKNGSVQNDYEVTVESVTDPDGEPVIVTDGVFTATKTGTYKATYTAGEGVEKAVLEVEFTKPAPMAVASFDKNANNLRVWRNWATLAYDTETKYGEEDGSLKVTRAAAGEIYITLDTPETTDLTNYDYLVFRVYNPTDAAVKVGICWWAEIECAPNEWTEIKIDLDAAWSAVASNGVGHPIDDLYTGKDIPRNNIKGLTLRVLSGMEIGERIYISAVYVTCE